MNNTYKVVVYDNSTDLEEGLNQMTSDGYTFVAFTRGVSGKITVIYSKN